MNKLYRFEQLDTETKNLKTELKNFYMNFFQKLEQSKDFKKFCIFSLKININIIE